MAKTYRKRTYKRRNYSKKKVVKRRTEPIYRIPYPKSRAVMFKYSYFNNISVTTDSVGTQKFRANSLFDPDFTGIGQQPRYYDQLCTENLYTLYRVDSIGYNVKYINKSTSSDALVGVSFRNQASSVPADATALWHEKELAYTTVKTLLPLGQSGSRTTIKGKLQMSSILASSKLSYKTDRSSYESLFSSNPAAVCFMMVMVSDDPNNNAGTDIDIYVTIYFKCIVSELTHTIPIS